MPQKDNRRKKLALRIGIALVLLLAAVIIAMLLNRRTEEATYRLDYPELISQYAGEYDLDPYLVAAVIHVEKRADAQHCAEEAGRLGDPAALDIEGKVGGEKPVMQAELVCLYPIMKLIDALALVTHIGECVHDKTVAGGCTERVNDVYLSVGVLCLEHLGCGAGGVDGAGNTG